MAKQPSTAVAVKEDQTTAVAVIDPTGYEAFAGSGFENQTSEDYAIPFLKVLQGLSPECESLDGAKPGCILNSVTNDIFKAAEGVSFVPVDTAHVFVEWKPKDQGGGIVSTHALNADVVVHAKETQDFGVYKTPAKNDLIETFYVYGILLDKDGNGTQACIAFTNTKIKKYKAWMAKAKAILINVKDANGRIVKRIQPPLFAHRYRLITVKEKNTKGEFWNWEVSFDGADAGAARIAPSDDIFQSALGLLETIRSGDAKLDSKGLDGGNDAPARRSSTEADTGEVPF